MKTQQIKASVKSVKIGSQKLLRVSSGLIGHNPIRALQMLKFSNLKAARIIESVLISAIANAENNFSLDPMELVIESCVVGKAASLKRFVARGRGKSNIIKRHYSNIFVKLAKSIKN